MPSSLCQVCVNFCGSADNIELTLLRQSPINLVRLSSALTRPFCLRQAAWHIFDDWCVSMPFWVNWKLCAVYYVFAGRLQKNGQMRYCLPDSSATNTSLCLHSFVPKSKRKGEEKTAVLGMSYRAVNQRETVCTALSPPSVSSGNIEFKGCSHCVIDVLQIMQHRGITSSRWTTEKCRSTALKMWISLTLVQKVERCVATQMQLVLVFCLLACWPRIANADDFRLFTTQMFGKQAKLMSTFWFAGKQRTNLRLHQPGFGALGNECDPFEWASKSHQLKRPRDTRGSKRLPNSHAQTQEKIYIKYIPYPYTAPGWRKNFVWLHTYQHPYESTLKTTAQNYNGASVSGNLKSRQASYTHMWSAVSRALMPHAQVHITNHLYLMLPRPGDCQSHFQTGTRRNNDQRQR